MAYPSQPRRPLHQRLWAKVEVRGGDACWEWTGYISQGGYGEIGRGLRGDGNVKTHRAAWLVVHGPIPPGMDVCHSCDNRRCCRPDHLFLGERRVNVEDMMLKGRGTAGRWSTPFPPARRRAIAAQYVPGETTQREIAVRHGISQATLSNWIRRYILTT